MIPFQAHTLEPILQPGDAVFFSYDFDIVGQARGGPDGLLEILSFEFRDPAATGSLASFDATTLDPSQVPLPASAALLVAGFAVMGLARRRARRR